MTSIFSVLLSFMLMLSSSQAPINTPAKIAISPKPLLENFSSPDPKESIPEPGNKNISRRLSFFKTKMRLADRFTSVDPVINKEEALANPQLWNLYSYCRNNPITFNDPDGRTEITFYIKEGILEINPQKEGRKRYEIAATSGRDEYMNDPKKTNVKNKGPIPQGKYNINSDEISDPFFLTDLARTIFRGDWGDWRVPIKPESETNTFDRDGFFLHGGTKKGSAGCIDIGGGIFGNIITDIVKKDIQSDPDKKVPLTVISSKGKNQNEDKNQ